MTDPTTGEREDRPGLTWQDIDWRGHRMRLADGKTGPRAVPLTRQIEAALQDLRRFQIDTATVHEGGDSFLSDKDLRVRNPLNALRSSARRVGIHRKVSVRDLRPTALTALGRRGFAACEIMKVSGHRDLKTTSTYLRLSEDHLVSQFRDEYSSARRGRALISKAPDRGPVAECSLLAP